MLQRPVRSAAARIVDQDHGGDRSAVEDIKRHQPAGSSSGLENRPFDLWTCTGYAGHVTGFYRPAHMKCFTWSIPSQVTSLQVAAGALCCPEMDTAIHAGTNAR